MGMHKLSRNFFATVTISMTLTVSLTSHSSAQQARDLIIIASSAAGSGYDAYARLLARHMPKHMPGTPAAIVNNMPGGAGIRAANYLYNVAPKDGSTIAHVDRAIQTAPLLYGADSKAQFDATRFIQIGSVMKETGMVVLSTQSPVNSIGDMQRTEIIVGASGPEQDPAMYPRLLNQLTGAKFKIVYGYKAQPDIFHAVEKGEVQGLFMSGWSGNGRAYVLDKATKGEMKLLMQLALERDPRHANTPTILETLSNDQDKQIVGLLLSRLLLGRPFIAPPGVPGERVALLRKAFRSAIEDPDLIAEAEKTRLAIDPVWGEEAQNVIAAMYKTDPATIEKVRKVIKVTE